MYSFGVSLRQESILAAASKPSQNNVSDVAFSSQIEDALKPGSTEMLDERVVEEESPYRKLSQVDRAVQKDIQTVFGIEPYKPGDSLKPALNSLWTFHSEKSGPISIVDMASNAEKASGIFQKHLSKFMLNENVSTRPPIELSYTGDGTVRVQDDHPDKAKIEEFINGNEELRNLYAGIVSTKSLVASAEESARFQERYAVDPKAAVAEFSHLFSGNYSYNTRLVIGEEAWSYQTQSVWRI